MSLREAAALLALAWARHDGPGGTGRWILGEPRDGILFWVHASDEEVRILEHLLATDPALAVHHHPVRPAR